MRAIPTILEILRESLDWREIHGKGALFLGRVPRARVKRVQKIKFSNQGTFQRLAGIQKRGALRRLKSARGDLRQVANTHRIERGAQRRSN